MKSERDRLIEELENRLERYYDKVYDRQELLEELVGMKLKYETRTKDNTGLITWIETLKQNEITLREIQYEREESLDSLKEE